MTNLFEHADYFTVMAVDPGETTGVAVVNATPEKVELMKTFNVRFELEDVAAFRDDMLAIFGYVAERNAPETAVLLVEKFTAVGGTPGVDLTPLTVMGAVEMMFHTLDDAEMAAFRERVRYQIPAHMRPFHNNKPLVKQVRHYMAPSRATRSNHEVDAIAHALVYLAGHGHRPSMTVLAGEGL